VEVHVLQGERPMASDNKTIGRFHLDGIPSAPRGVPQIEVTFDIDANGILAVSAKDMGTGKEQKITITASSGLAKDEVERMVQEAKSHETEDKKRREDAEVRNHAEGMAHSVEKSLKELGDKVPADKRKELEDAAAALRDDLKKDGDVEGLKKKAEALAESMAAVSTELYKNAKPEGAPQEGAAPEQAAPEAKTVDADFEVVDEKKD
ncbi:MAG: Hsp70 family protein, partial [bacterium]